MILFCEHLAYIPGPLWNIPPKNPKIFQKISQKISKILKTSNSLHRTFRARFFIFVEKNLKCFFEIE